MLVVGGLGHFQVTTDRLEAQIIAIGFKERHRHLRRLSNSTCAKCKEALRSISLAWRISMTSRSSSLTLSRSLRPAPLTQTHRLDSFWPRQRDILLWHSRLCEALLV